MTSNSHRILAVLAVAVFIATACMVAILPSDESDASADKVYRYQYRPDREVQFDVYVEDADGGSHLAAGLKHVFYSSYDGKSNARTIEVISYDGDTHDFYTRTWRGSMDPLDYYTGNTFSAMYNDTDWRQVGGYNYGLTNGEYHYITIQRTGEVIDHIEIGGSATASDNQGYFAETVVQYYGSGSGLPDDYEHMEEYSTEPSGTIDYTIPAGNPTNGDMIFKGYGLSGSGPAIYQPGQTIPVPVGDTLTLWAVWQEPSADVTFMSNGSVYETVTVPIGQTVPMPDDPVLEGYDFEGWFTNSGCTTPFDESTKLSGDLTLYAKWVRQSYTVNFLDSDGTVLESITVNGGQTVSVPEEPTAPEGYVFVGWYTDNTHTTQFDFGEPIDRDTNVYAYFEEELCFTSEPKALYSLTKIAGVENTYVFQVLEESCSTSVHWDFGDGKTSEDRFVTHYFEDPGTYSVTLTVYNNHGEATDTFDVVIPGDDEGGSDLLLYVAIGLIAVVIVAVIVTRFV